MGRTLLSAAFVLDLDVARDADPDRDAENLRLILSLIQLLSLSFPSEAEEPAVLCGARDSCGEDAA